MTCSPFDLRDYLLGELSAGQRQSVDTHLTACEACRQQMEQWDLTKSALLTLPDEEIPQRIGFVSDRVFEPSGWRRWWLGFWNSGPRLVFASSMILAAAITAAPWLRPAPAPVKMATAAPITVDVSKIVAEAVAKAVAESEARHADKTQQLLAAAEKRYEFERQADRVAVEESFAYVRKRLNVMLVASRDLGGTQ